MLTERLGDLGSAADVLRRDDAGTRRFGLAPPAALIGDWFGNQAVIAPTVDAAPVHPADVFDAPTGSGGDAVGGGWIGYLSYPDFGADGAPPRIPQAAGGWTDCVLRLDRCDGWWYESLSGAALPDWVTAALREPVELLHCDIDWQQPSSAVHRAAVLSCLEAIEAGEVYQACVCTQFSGNVNGLPVHFFADAVARTSPARAAYLAGDWGAVASLSPELFLRRVGEQVSSSPIKGTLPRHADPALLRASAKDVAENIMIVDLVRNDLGRVARTGSVTVSELLAVHPAPGVWHLVSTVSAQVPLEVPIAGLLAAAFPPASVTGTPKTRARQLLSQWEPHRRGVYCGTVGMASPVAGCELNVAIRTVEFGADSRAVLGVGGGITADSDPDAEWQECLDKAAPIVHRQSPPARPDGRARSTAS
ncbi:MAG: aminodeoxychorismate synthase component I [Mycobacterium sp.]|nr:aminodeoxychorismate synthase component I [Mycobacterium sp.]